MSWTAEQEAAMNARDCNLLVSAAAGSGKTAVLVERIFGRLTDRKHPVNIDSIVVVTFTKAAASEMKARLLNRIEEALAVDPGNRHLVRQLSLIDHAQITTIDSFCSYVLRNYYHVIGLDPAFRIADEGELSLLQAEVFEALQEEYFAGQKQDFLDFLEAFAPGKNFSSLFQMVKELYTYSQSSPWPLEWLRSCDQMYHIQSVEELADLRLIKDTVAYIHNLCRDTLAEYDALEQLIKENASLAGYQKNIDEDRQMIQSCLDCETLDGMRLALSAGFGRLAAVRTGEEELRDRIKTARAAVKERFKRIKEQFLEDDAATMLSDIQGCGKYADILIGMTAEFTKRYTAAKEEKNILDFSDLEHKALEILVYKDEQGKVCRRQTAKELAFVFEEIYIDEYQDSSYVQEYILTAVSRCEDGTPNIFMVGDVKQSIYGFRLAKPELFMEKYHTYKAEGDYRKIELHTNFRSCRNVIDCVNDIFYRIMKESVGGIAYNDENRLNYCGGKVSPDKIGDETELLVAAADEFSEEELVPTELCAHIAAKRIREMMQENPALSYRDFVILLRSDKKAGPVYASVLISHGIPAIHASTTGYFTSPEILDVLNYLKIIDNPRQEIPLAGVMRSYFSFFQAEEMALIKGTHRRTEFYDCLLKRSTEPDALGNKCRQFLEQLEQYRKMQEVCSIRELLLSLIYDTGYYDYVGLLTGGHIRKANLELLVMKAADFEKTSYTGLFHFLQYVDKLQTYEVDYGEAPSNAEQDNAVRIMSIHKSKGLQFPVVMIGEMHHQYNLRDVSKSVLLDNKYGIGIDAVDLYTRIRKRPAIKRMLANKLLMENIGEELRILYVAMTRAVDKLILIGAAAQSAIDAWERTDQTPIDMAYILEHKNYLNLIAPVLYSGNLAGNFSVVQYTKEELLAYTKEAVQNRTGVFKEYLDGILDGSDRIPDLEDKFKEIHRQLNFTYPHDGLFSLRSKYSVSELKHQAMEESELLEALVTEPDRCKPVPQFLQEKSEQNAYGTIYGNAYHKFFELLDYAGGADEASLRRHLERLVSEGRISSEYAGLIQLGKFTHFLGTELGRRMKQAALSGRLYREQPFIMEIDASEVDASYPADEKVLVQGIIDAFFFEEDNVYLVDYKTDRIPENTDGELFLKERYEKQLALYKEVLSKVTHKTVGGCYIYSVSLGKSILL